MTRMIAASAFALTIGFAFPSFAATQAECDAAWGKMDTKKAGYVMASDAKDHVAMMTKAGRKMAAADRISSKEFVESCLADVFMKSSQ